MLKYSGYLTFKGVVFMKKLFRISSILSIFLSVCGSYLFAGSSDNLLVNDDRIFALGNKYTSLVASMYEEETSHIGLKGYHYNLEKHTAQNEIAKIKSLTAFSEAIEEIDPSSLSPFAQADYYTLKELVGLKYFNAKIKNQLEEDPLWYLQPIDGVYELLIKNFLPGQERLSYALKRLEMIPTSLQDAEMNITNPPDLTLRLTIEKTKLENTYLPNLTALVLRISDDKVTKNKIKQLSEDIKTSLSRYETFLNSKLKEKEFSDFRIGEENYKYLYQDVYSVPMKYSKLENLLEKTLNKAQKNLIEGITPKVLPLLSEEEKQNRTIKKNVKIYPGDYYLLAAKYKNAPEYDNVLKSYSAEIKKADQFLTTKRLFPSLTLPITVITAPPILRAEHEQVTIYPPVPLADKQSADILVSLPKKAGLNKSDFEQEYNYGKIKFNTAEFVTPGKTLIYSVEPANLSLLYKLSNDIFYIHGWINYSLNTAAENGLLNTEQDNINLLWFNYKKAIYALVDYKLQTLQFDYTSALAYITQAGIDSKEAEVYLDYLALHPFDAVSYIIGAQEFERLKAKYKKELGKKFDLLTFHTKILSLGRIPLISMEEALKRAYTKKEVDSYFSMTYF